MKGINPKDFGQRVCELRKAHGWSQTRLAEESDQSQSNIGWIEKGKAKDPRKQAISLAEALQSTPEWLLYGTGAKQIGPRVLTTEQLCAIYDAMPLAAKLVVTTTVEKHRDQKKKA